jgi:tRNA pseudouridine synthase 10
MTDTLDNKNILETVEKILPEYCLCDSCLGRLFTKTQKGVSNEDIGSYLRKKTGFNKKIKSADCELCQGLSSEVEHFCKLILDSLKGYEFNTFLIGCKIDEDIIEKENELIKLTESKYSESIKNELNRNIGLKLEKKLDKLVDFEKPDIMVVLDTSFDFISLQIASLFIYGRYKKYTRDMPQTKWFCKICYGKGCRKCDYNGKIYENSVEELVSKEILKATKGTDESFHGAGREDVDVRMLGTGRPFILEIKNPKIRSINLDALKEKINSSNKELIKVDNLRFSDRNEIARIKNAGFRKIYRVVIKSDIILNNEKLKKVSSSLQDSNINQLTPLRVAHRRADMVREKHIYSCIVESVEDSIATLSLETESGTYIKELVTGDDGRTKPSISEILGSPCRVVELDVIEIKGE